MELAVLTIIFILLVIGYLISLFLDYHLGRLFTGFASHGCSLEVTYGRVFLYTIFRSIISYSAGYLIGIFTANPILRLIIPINIVEGFIIIVSILVLFTITYYLFQFRNIACTGAYLVSDTISSILSVVIILLIGLVIGLSSAELLNFIK